METLTERQAEVLNFIVSFAREHGFPPSIREIAADLKLCSSTVQQFVDVLIRKGKLEREPSQRRNLRLGAGLATHGIAGLGSRAHPILGSAPAGRPNLAQEDVEGMLWLDETVSRSKDSYILKIKGDSMIGAGILSGDLIVVRPQKAPDFNSVVVAQTEDGEVTVKYLRKDANGPFLEAANPAYSPIRSPFQVVGRVVSVIRRL
ncbi:MAG: repressor LexA [Elusimicrobia bacterium]|nr:repressor LexA [Elusimicrobiota bacterium]